MCPLPLSSPLPLAPTAHRLTSRPWVPATTRQLRYSTPMRDPPHSFCPRTPYMKAIRGRMVLPRLRHTPGSWGGSYDKARPVDVPSIPDETLAGGRASHNTAVLVHRGVSCGLSRPQTPNRVFCEADTKQAVQHSTPYRGRHQDHLVLFPDCTLLAAATPTPTRGITHARQRGSVIWQPTAHGARPPTPAPGADARPNEEVF